MMIVLIFFIYLPAIQ